MKSPITKGCLIRRTGEAEIGIVVSVEQTHARVNFKTTSGFMTGYFPLNSLELVLAPNGEAITDRYGFSPQSYRGLTGPA